MRELLRIGGMCVHDLLEETASVGRCSRARSPSMRCSARTTARARPARYCRCSIGSRPRQEPTALPLPQGGLGAVSEALARAARAPPARSLRTGAPVTRILVREDRAPPGWCWPRARGDPRALVISSADPKTTFLGLAGE